MENENIFDIAEIENIYGISKSKDVLLDFIKYVELRKQNEISDQFGNFNISIKCNKSYDTTRLIEFIYNVLKYNGIISTDYIKFENIYPKSFRGLYGIEEEMIIISTNKTNINVRGNADFIQDLLQETNKIIVMIFNDEFESQNTNYEPYFIKTFIWQIEVEDLTDSEKQQVILDKLNQYDISVASDCNVIKKLVLEDITKVEKEILYLLVKCKANKTTTITNDFLREIHREDYIDIDKIQTHKARDELDSLEGLENVKKQILNILNYVIACKTRNTSIPCLHMFFTGNQGCGKTSVAKIVGKIFAEEHILSNEYKYTEIHARDLVGKYVGWTAQKVKNIVKEAEGRSTFYRRILFFI